MTLPNVKSPEAKIFIVLVAATIIVNLAYDYIPAVRSYA